MVSTTQSGTVSNGSSTWLVDPIGLPKPRVDFGVSLAKVLAARRSSRGFDPARKLPRLVLSELMSCAGGIKPSADR